MDRFDSSGRLIIPIGKPLNGSHKSDEVRYVITEAYCPNGCNIIDNDHPINGYPGLRMKFSRPGMEGELVLSAVENDFTKIILCGELAEGVKDELSCPHCDAMFKKLVSCSCCDDADMVIIGLTPKLDFNNAITFCNVTGCNNGSFVKSGDVLRHIRLHGQI